jgi:hypothetical protein
VEPEGKGPLERSRRMWVDNINMCLGEIGWCGWDWISLVQDKNRWTALVNMAINLPFPSNATASVV